MNLNDFVVLPNNKAKSIKLNARNLQELQMETISLAQESKEMEEKLQLLKQSMSKEKEERGHSGGIRWKAGQCGSLTSNALTNSAKKSKENRLQKLSAGKMKIRVLKDESLSALPQPPPPPPPAGIGVRTTRKNRLRGAICGQCEVKTAGLICAECTENYCIGCFARFHQKGALKLHRMITIQTDLTTHVSTQDVARYSASASVSADPSPNSKINPSHTSTGSTSTRRGDESAEKGTEAMAKSKHSETGQVLVVNPRKEKNVDMIDEAWNREDEEGFPTSLIRGEYDEEVSARSFQEALRQWRGETSNEARNPIREDAMWIPVRSVSVSAMATQADLPADREAVGQGCRGGRRGVPVRVEFTEKSLTYTDRLLLKKHRRTPVETYDPSIVIGPDLQSLQSSSTEEDSCLTAQEEDFRHYCASLFAVPVSSDRTEAQITTPAPCLVIEVLDETDRDINGVFVAEHRTSNKTRVSTLQQVSSSVKALVPQTSGGSLRVNLSSPTQRRRQSKAPTQSETAQNLRPSRPQTSQAESSMKSSASKGIPLASPTAEPRWSSKTSIKKPISMSQKSNRSQTIHKSKPDDGSPQLSQIEIPKFSSPLSFPPDVTPLASTRSSTPKQHLFPSPSISPSLRSTFTVTPSGSTDLTLLPRVNQSTPLQKGPNSSLLPEQFQSSKLFPGPISSPKLLQSPPSNLESPQQSQESVCDPECLLSVNQLQLPQSSNPNPQTKSLGPSPSQTTPVPFRAPVKTPSRSSLFYESTPDVHSAEDAPVLMSSTSISGDHELAPSHQDTDAYIPSSSPHPLNVTQSPHLALEMTEELKLSVDSDNEMSSDSLGLTAHEEGSSDEEAQTHGCLTRERSREEAQEDSAISHRGDSFVHTDAEGEKYLWANEPEQLSEPSMVMHNQSAGSGSEHFCDLDGFSPLGLDLNSGHSDTPEHTHSDPRRTCQTSPHDSDRTESGGPSSSLSNFTEEHLVFSVMEDNHMQPTGIQICSATPTRRGETSANELRTSGSDRSCTSHTPRITPRPFPASVSPSLSQSPSCPPSTGLSHPTLGSEVDLAVRPLCRAAQEIMEICGMDQSGCEDPDLDSDTAALALHSLDRELRLMAKETASDTLASVFHLGNSGSEDQHGNQCLTRDRVSEEQKEEEEAAQRDRQSVLLLH